jgi:hypothetical protein
MNQQRESQEPSAKIATSAVQLLHQHTGRGPTKAKTTKLVMRDELIELVERELDRKVIAFMSQNHIDPDLAVEFFVLEPAETV